MLFYEAGYGKFIVMKNRLEALKLFFSDRIDFDTGK